MLFVMFIAGIMIGSFINVVIYRLPIMLETSPENFNILFPRSRCNSCKTQILWYWNIPIISYILLRGKCCFCKSQIGIRYPLIELINGVFYILVYLFIPHYIFAAIFCSLLLIAAVIDFDTMILPDEITLLLLWIGLIFNTYSGYVVINDAVIGAAAGYMILWLLYWALKLCLKKDTMGYGDFKLYAGFGACFGWQHLTMIALIASGFAILYTVSLRLFSKFQFNQPVPFGPFLCCAGFYTLFTY